MAKDLDVPCISVTVDTLFLFCGKIIDVFFDQMQKRLLQRLGINLRLKEENEEIKEINMSEHIIHNFGRIRFRLFLGPGSKSSS